MTLQDHFRPPLSERRHWHAFHNAWATYIASALNERLPAGYFAEPNVQFGIEIDVATFEEATANDDARAAMGDNSSGDLGNWMPPAPTATIPFTIATDVVEVLVYDRETGPVLAGAIELISPANKDRPAHREAFAAKCLAYLNQGLGLVIVDLVTSRAANMHDELLARVEGDDASRHAAAQWGAALYAAAYRPVERDVDHQTRQMSLDIWREAFSLGKSLSTLPLWLRGEICLPVDFDATYPRTCREQRIVSAN